VTASGSTDTPVGAPVRINATLASTGGSNQAQGFIFARDIKIEFLDCLRQPVSRNKNCRALKISTAILAILAFTATSVSFATSTPKTERLTGHVLGYVPNLLQSNGDGGELLPFIFIPDSSTKEEQQISPVAVGYRFFSGQAALPDTFFDYAKRFQIDVTRNSACDTTAGDFFYLKIFSDKKLKKPSGRIYRFQLSTDAPKLDFADSLALLCYEMTPGNYSLLK
jgi:hypothetical protein